MLGRTAASDMLWSLTVEVVRQVAAVAVLQDKTQFSYSLERFSNQNLNLCWNIDHNIWRTC